MSVIGSAAKYQEAFRHCSGTAVFLDDIKLPNMAYCAFVRSTYAHARIRSVNTSRAENMPGVLKVLTSRDISSATTRLKLDVPLPGMKPLYYAYLASSKVRFTGEPIAVVLATDRYVAEDAVDQIEVEYEPLSVIMDAEKALEPNAALLYEEWGDNVLVKVSFKGGDTESAFSSSDHVFEERFYIHRYAGVPLETRGCMASYDQASRVLTCWISSQGPHVHKTLLAEALGLAEHKVRVISPDVGGGFGTKLNLAPEDVVVAYLALATGRTAKWTETRREHLLAANHAREQVHKIQVALKRGGEILGIRDSIVGDLGYSQPFPHSGLGTLLVAASMLPGPYRILNYDFEVKAVVTNKAPFGAYRGFGQPEATFVMERMLDIICRELNLDPLQTRLKNMLTAKELPFQSVTGAVWDSGDFPATLKKALDLADYHTHREKQQSLREKGRYIGIGIGCNTETTAPSLRFQSGRWAAHDAAKVKLEPDGSCSVFVGVSSIGTGIETSLAQVAADVLGMQPEDVMVHLGDTQTCPYSSGNWGSRSAAVCGSAILLASKKLKDKTIQIAAHLIQARPDRLAIGHKRVYCVEDENRFVSFREIAHVAYNEIFRLPEGMEPGLEFTSYYNPPGLSFAPDDKGRINVTGACSNAAHVAIVEVDPDTGSVQILRYVACHDSGVIINPAIVEGQIVGGVAQSIGGTMYEFLAYDDSGQLLTSTFMDYLMPTAREVPNIEVVHLQTPSPNIPGGFKGAGESGTISAPAAIVNAIEDAVSPLAPKIRITKSLVTPESLWKELSQSRSNNHS